jgi:hypothetical protein
VAETRVDLLDLREHVLRATLLLIELRGFGDRPACRRERGCETEQEGWEDSAGQSDGAPAPHVAR